jgi:hypothetical protein
LHQTFFAADEVLFSKSKSLALVNILICSVENSLLVLKGMSNYDVVEA